MPTMKCPECGKMISIYANRCPHCGRESPNLSNGDMLVIRIIAIGVGIYIFCKLMF